jgi:hypothetical protein
MPNKYEKYRRTFCDCGRPTYAVSVGAWVCRPCFEAQSRFDYINMIKSNQAANRIDTPAELTERRIEARERRNSVFAEPYTVRLAGRCNF